MPRLSITLSQERHRAVKEAAARRGTTITTIIDESLEACGVKSQARAEELVARARSRSSLSPEEAERLAVAEVRAFRAEQQAKAGADTPGRAG
jgi:hypothetical protein